MGQIQDPKPDERYPAKNRLVLIRYTALTVAIFVPLLLAFGSIRNLYPFAASTMMIDRELQRERHYYILRGETVGGETIELPPIELTDALTGRNWSLVSTAVENKSFKIRRPHPVNISLLAASGGVDKVPKAARLGDLLRAWGAIYNSRLPEASSYRLKSVKLDAYRWEGGINGEYDRFVESWRAVP